MLSLRVFLNERLAALAEDIFGAVEKTIAEYTEEICRSKDLEINHLRMQLKLLKSGETESDKCADTQEPRSPSPSEPQHPAEAAFCEEDDAGDSTRDHKHPGASLVKMELQKTSGRIWMDVEEPFVEIDPHMMPALKIDPHDQTPRFQPFLAEESKDKAFICTVCEKRFSNCSHLEAHIRTHTGERPYMCDICRKTFITTSALNRHKTIHTEGKRYVCTYCGKSFKWMDSLGRHMRSVHKRENVPE